MRRLLTRLPRPVRRFRRDERGSYSVELMLVLPIILYGYVAMFVFFDAFRQQNVNLKASYTIADVLSRQTEPIDADWMDGLSDLLDYLTTTHHDTQIRATVVYWDADEARHVRVWSEASDGLTGLDQDGIDSDLSPRNPLMADHDTAIVLETFMLYEPLFQVGIGPTEFHNVVVTSPRFAPQLCWNDCGATGSATAHDDGTDKGAETVDTGDDDEQTDADT